MSNVEPTGPVLRGLRRAHQIREQRLRLPPPEPPVPLERIPDGRPLIYGRDYYIDDDHNTVLTRGRWSVHKVEKLITGVLALIGVRR
ncbi:hypothetical protein [Nocardia cyriacigeorgica]|uniref:Uncharacterized protein n=1 Tax=Nocardia cyriacigeorgica TaxID=135487 RepID=A0A5R8NB11_9NOCA|nr:hypothetical protein [Nocardia cyriacigeorgica]TLF72899.1 hypothetical protein FEK34_28155 [Nocardia cyriacigeorgica]